MPSAKTLRLALAAMTAMTATTTMVIGSGCSFSREFLEPTSPAPISHVILVKMKDPAQIDALIAESVRDLGAIPSVTTLAAGRPLDTGREGIVSDYDVALYMGFKDTAGYDLYSHDPRHTAFVERWMPHVESVVIRDFTDDRR